MSSMAGAIGGWEQRSVRRLPNRLRQVLGWTALVLLAFLACLFSIRRLAGGFEQALSGAELVAAAAVVSAVLLGIRAALARAKLSVVPCLAASLAAALLIAAMTIPGTPPWGVALAWFLLATSVLRACLPAQRRRSKTLDAPLETGRELPPAANLVQQITRERQPDGSEALHALVQAEIPTGDRLAVVHLAFCPPLASAPKLAAQTVDANDAEVRVTTAETYGLRLEVRLTQVAAAARRVLVEIFGRASL